MRICINDKDVSLNFGRKVILKVKLDWWIRFLSHIRDHRPRGYNITMVIEKLPSRKNH